MARAFERKKEQVSLPLGGDRRATGTASAPTTTSAASLAAPKIASPPTRPSGRASSPSLPSPPLPSANASTATPSDSSADRDRRPTTGRSPCILSDGGRTLPSGVTFTDNGNGTATLSGTPAAGTAGTYPFTITASNGGHCSTPPRPSPSRSTRRARSPAPPAPPLTSASPGPLPSRRPGSPTCGLSETGALPPGVTFKDNGDGTATLSGTPAAGTGGTYPFTITATNGGSRCRHPDLHPHGQPGVPDHQRYCTTPPSPSARPGPLRHIGRAAHVHIVRDGRTAVGSHVHGQRGRHGDTCGTPAAGTGGTYTFTITATNVPVTPPRASPSRSTRRARSPALTTPPLP